MTDALTSLDPCDHLVELSGAVATVTLNRPAAYNALTADLIGSLLLTFQVLEADERVRAIVFTGAGKGFCSGQALDDRRSLPESGAAQLGETVRQRYNPLLATMLQLEKPLVAAINGVAAGAGFGLALACDFRVVGAGATFTTAFVKIGLVPDSGVTLLLPRIVGYARALELCVFAERFDAARADTLGLVTRLVPDDMVAGEAAGLAAQLAAGPKSLAYVKRELVRTGLGDVSAALDFEAEMQSLAGATEDFNEGLAAFAGKRPPVFRGR